MKLVKFLYKKFCLFVLNFVVDDNEKANAKFRNFVYRSLGMKIGRKCYISKNFSFLNPNNIVLKNNVCLGINNTIQAFSKVTIGEYCQTALNLTIVSGTHNNEDFGSVDKACDVTIGPGCWIGANVLILSGVTIGKGCVIGAGSVVNKNIPDFSIAAGVPCKVIKKRLPAKIIVHPSGNYELSLLDNL